MRSVKPTSRIFVSKKQMASKRLNIKPHVRRIKAHHKRHKKKLLALYHKVRQHPGCYRPGYKPKKGARVPKSVPRQPAGFNKKGAGLWTSIKSAWKWITGHKVVQDMKKEVVGHAKKQASALAEEAKKRAIGYGKAQIDRGSAWLKRQGEAAAKRVRGKVEKHLSEAHNKVEGVANRIDKAVSSFTGASDDMPGKTVGAKKGSGIASALAQRIGMRMVGKDGVETLGQVKI